MKGQSVSWSSGSKRQNLRFRVGVQLRHLDAGHVQVPPAEQSAQRRRTGQTVDVVPVEDHLLHLTHVERIEQQESLVFALLQRNARTWHFLKNLIELKFME